MRTLAQNTRREAIQSSGEPKPILTLFRDDSLARFPNMDLEEVRQLSRFMPIVVLIPTSDAGGSLIPHKVTDAEPLARRVHQLRPSPAKVSRPRNRPDTNETVVFGDAAVNFSTMEAWRNGAPVTLTAMEFKMLRYMIANQRRVISRNELLNEVWGYDNYPCTRTVDNHLLRLRQKLEREPSRPAHFRTVHGFGYKFLLDAL